MHECRRSKIEQPAAQRGARASGSWDKFRLGLSPRMREFPPWSTRHICACGQNDTFAWPAPNLIAGWRTISRLSDVNFWPEPRPFNPSSRRGSGHSPAKATRGRNRTGPAAGRWRSLSSILFASPATQSTAAAGSRSGADARPDHDGIQAAETRRNLFGALCDTATLLRGAFPLPFRRPPGPPARRVRLRGDVSLTFGLEIHDALASRALAIVITRPWLDVLE